MEKTLGGDRLGSGKKMKVDLHGYGRSTHNMGYIFRSTMSAGTLVPFLSELALPGDTFDIDLDCDIKTHPTIGPLFGSYKVQLDVFLTPIRLYQGKLHNNKLGIGMNMASIKLPLINLPAGKVAQDNPNIDSAQINPSCIMPYLGVRGIGMRNDKAMDIPVYRGFNAIPLLAYWDIYKNYYANKQEEIGAVIHAQQTTINQTVDSIKIDGSTVNPGGTTTPARDMGVNAEIEIAYTGTAPSLLDIIFTITGGIEVQLQLIAGNVLDDGAGTIIATYMNDYGPTQVVQWGYRTATTPTEVAPRVTTFPLENIDTMREEIYERTTQSGAVILNDIPLAPYNYLSTTFGTNDAFTFLTFSQEGLAIKTYQSDLFNNWLSTEWIDGAGGITELTAIDTSGGSFTLDTLNLAKKVYEVMNRIAVSGGTYNDWIEASYDHEPFRRAETPMYMGGLIKELIFQEVVSNTETGDQPLGTLAGKGTMAKKHKGGSVTIKVDEPSYITGIISLTPRIDYSQGNKWDVNLKTMDELHIPGLDEIGFQELITEQMAWWDTTWNDTTSEWVTKSAGKQPAWINYMTNVNRVYGNFALPDNEMFMTLNRKYEWEDDADDVTIKDLTTYIDPVKYNNIFAQTSLDAQNFWAQIAIDMTARRKMSARLMPNL